jgi:hypothetical protein
MIFQRVAFIACFVDLIMAAPQQPSTEERPIMHASSHHPADCYRHLTTINGPILWAEIPSLRPAADGLPQHTPLPRVCLLHRTAVVLPLSGRNSGTYTYDNF